MDDQATTLLHRMIRNDRFARDLPFHDGLKKVQHDFTVRNALGHSRYRIELDRCAAAEYEFRAKAWFDVAKRLVAELDLPWTKPAAEAIKYALATELSTDWEQVYAALQQILGPNAGSPRIGETEKTKNRMQSHLEHEIDLLLLKQDRSRVPIFEQLQAPRYADVLAGYRKARALAAAVPPDLANSAKEAANAVEQLARVVVRDPNATLGQAIKALKSGGRLQPPLLKGIEEIWGWSSSVPSVRHGSAAESPVTPAATQYILTIADAALALLLSLDAV
jgi:hypothetical protein